MKPLDQESNKMATTKKSALKSKSLSEKEKQLLDKIDKAKKDLLKLKDRRKNELGEMAIKAGLHAFDDHDLKSGFEKLAKELKS